jgi:hypothetical protein
VRRVPAPAIWSIVLMAIPLVVLAVLGILAAIGIGPVTRGIAAFAPTLVIGSWVVSIPIAIVTIVAVRGRWKIAGIAALALAALEPIAGLAIWIGTG